MTHPWLLATGLPRVLAHRGLIPRLGDRVAENSLTAIAAAHAAGASYIETDCRITRDGVVVLAHDADLSRVADDSSNVAELTHAELSARLQPFGGLLTLEDAVNGFPTVRFNIDVKVDAAAVPAGRLVAPHAARVLLTSFSDRRRTAALAAAAAARPGVRPATSAGAATIARVLLHMHMGNRAGAIRALQGIDALQIPRRHRGVPVLSSRLIDLAHRCGVEVHVWTVNSLEQMTDLVAEGVDGIVTDRVDLALELLSPRQ